MEERYFWTIIDESKQEAKRNVEIQIDMLYKKLRELSPEQLISFDSIKQEIFSKAWSQKLDAAYFAIEGVYLTNGDLYASDEGFYGFIFWLIAQGKEVYSKTLESPDYLADLVNIGDEINMELAFGIADEVYFEKTQCQFPRMEQRMIEIEGGKEVDFSVNDFLRPEIISVNSDYYKMVQERCPKLWEKFRKSRQKFNKVE